MAFISILICSSIYLFYLYIHLFYYVCITLSIKIFSHSWYFKNLYNFFNSFIKITKYITSKNKHTKITNTNKSKTTTNTHIHKQNKNTPKNTNNTHIQQTQARQDKQGGGAHSSLISHHTPHITHPPCTPPPLHCQHHTLG